MRLSPNKKTARRFHGSIFKSKLHRRYTLVCFFEITSSAWSLKSSYFCRRWKVMYFECYYSISVSPQLPHMCVYFTNYNQKTKNTKYIHPSIALQWGMEAKLINFQQKIVRCYTLKRCVLPKSVQMSRKIDILSFQKPRRV